MRYLFTFIILAALVSSCKNSDRNGSAANGTVQGPAVTDTAQFTTIQWIDSVKDYGKIQEGLKLEVAFRFKNTGNKPLVISRVQPSCGCTVAEQSTEPVPPGGEGLVKATFSSEGRTGVNHKTLFVFANTKGTQNHSLQFVVEVAKKS